ncbi:MAG TPA: hypothetical protein VGG38_15515 [Acidimicrobiales bacterium]|jgi:hypothetical protein
MGKSDPQDPLAGVSLMGVLAARIRMTEGQLYTVLIALLLALLLTLTGLPNAHKSSGTPLAPSFTPTTTQVTQP